jgi:large subunit ribosomal protein L9
MAVKVILTQDVPELGKVGEIKQVAPGFFRNYLLPRGLATEATKGQVSALQSEKSRGAAKSARAAGQTSTLARQIQEVTLRVPVHLGEQGRIFGSVTNKDIAEALAAQAGITVDRHRIELREPLRAVGVHTVTIKLEHGIDTQVHVELVPDTELATT